MISLVNFLSYFSILLGLPGIIYLLINFDKITYKRWSYLILFVESFVITGFSIILSKLEHSNFLLLNIDSTFIFLVLISFYFDEVKKLATILLISYLVYFLWYASKFGLYSECSTLFTIVSLMSIVIIIVSLYINSVSIEKYNIIWKVKLHIAIGLISYFSIPIFFGVFDNYFTENDKDFYVLITIFQFIASLLLNLFLFTSLWIQKKI